MASIEDALTKLGASRRLTLDALGGLTEAQLALSVPWRGRGADVRYLLLRLAEAEDEIRVALGLALEAASVRRPEAARILGGRLGQIRSLLVGLPDDVYGRKPSPADWSVGQALEHMRVTEERYQVQTEWAVRRLAEPDLPPRIPDDRLPALAPEPVAAPTVADALSSLEIAAAIVDARTSWLEGESLAAPTIWSGWDVDVRFRLHRFRAHARQHAIQIAKTLQSLGWWQSEAQLILGRAEEARAELEGMVIGLDDEMLMKAEIAAPALETALDRAVADEAATRAAVEKRVPGLPT